ncbi:MAG TPA: hypothetical protein VM491_23535 [Burkholderiaceae bacterium]|nr:hypothetical protein [Burkholderiaceae bacterium]
MSRLRLLLATALLAGLIGCASIGPTRVAIDRIDYSGALGESWARQTLLSIVRLRYLDVPVFMDVSSIVASYAIELGGDLSGVGRPSLLDRLSLNGRYSDRPTISYRPLTGRDFVQAMMTPLPPETVLSLIKSGWPTDLVFFSLTAQINGLRNAGVSLRRLHSEDPGFARVVRLLNQLDAARGASFVQSDTEEHGYMLWLRPAQGLPAELTSQIDELRSLLGLDAQASRVPVKFADISSSGDRIALRTRSIMEFLVAASAQVRVPPEDLAAGRVTAGLTAISDQAHQAQSQSRLIVHSGPSAPATPYVAARHRALWYWIDDDDLDSKQTFAFLMLLLTMAETGKDTGAPLLTLPAQ